MRATGRASRVLALLGCVAVLATFVAYSLLLQQQSETPVGPFGALSGAPTWFLAVLAATAVADGVAIWLPAGHLRRLLLTGTAMLLAAVGLVAIFSMGTALLLAAALTGAAAAWDRGPRRPRHAVQSN